MSLLVWLPLNGTVKNQGLIDPGFSVLTNVGTFVGGGLGDALN